MTDSLIEKEILLEDHVTRCEPSTQNVPDKLPALPETISQVLRQAEIDFTTGFAVPESTDVKETQPLIVEITETEDLLNHDGILNSDVVTKQSGIVNMECFPNPSNGLINLKYSLKRDAAVNITLHDVQGNLVKTFLSSQKIYAADYVSQFDVGELNNGIYICTVQSAGRTYSQRIVLER